ncbi:DsbA family protein [Cytophagaceae bacterium YF14B1]|uniref:DsbA family protein n=1 Tax=Xanthocytophaga flava TaxID=3048013 RepID=A0AAE3QMA6_9BACT|nr:DsbA family protein [Xanthocytophaga flavus]MDJ1481962.1 DsbA family protein [Xanthocytophaga flavus]
MKLPSILYIYDPLCFWCYGFGPTLQKLFESLHDKVHFEILSGGMYIGNQAGTVSQVSPYLKTAYKEIERQTGVPFGEKFVKHILEPGTAILNSEKPSIALTTFKSYQPENIVKFAHHLQEAFFYDGKDLTDDATYIPLAKLFGIDGEEFVKKMHHPDYTRKTKEEFKIVNELGASGFPTILLLTEKQNYLLTRGYIEFEPLYLTINQLLSPVS